MINHQNIKPRYEVHALDGEVEETYYVRDAKKGMNVEKKRTVPAGFMVYFPNGNSFRVRDKEELARLGYDNPAAFIDMESGDEIQMATSLKQNVQRRTTASKRRNASTSSVDANQ